MIQDQLFSMFPVDYHIPGQILLVPPREFVKLRRKDLGKNRMFILVCEGQLTLRLNGISHVMDTCTFLDLLEMVDVQIEELSPELKAWGLFITFSFASESMKNLRVGPQNQLTKWLHIPILSFSIRERDILERQLLLLQESLENRKHHYYQEMVQLYFKAFSLELGNILYCHEENDKDKASSCVEKKDFIVLRFMELVTKHFIAEHNVQFYADRLCISQKHLTRLLKEVLGKTPHEIICDEITHNAMAMLEDDKIPVRQIAEELHFSDQASFCKFFKKQMKIPPMAYRKKIIPEKYMITEEEDIPHSL